MVFHACGLVVRGARVQLLSHGQQVVGHLAQAKGAHSPRGVLFSWFDGVPMCVQVVGF